MIETFNSKGTWCATFYATYEKIYLFIFLSPSIFLIQLFTFFQRIIVGHAAWYALDDQDKQLVFPPAYHIWKDEMDSLEKLLPFLKQKMCTTHRNELEAASAFLTPTAKSEQFKLLFFVLSN